MRILDWWQERKLVSEARKLLSEARRLLRRKQGIVPAEDHARCANAAEELKARLSDQPVIPRYVERAAEKLEAALVTTGIKEHKGVFRQYAESIAWAVGIALLIRFFLFEPFKIPTGSMIPTLQENDHIFVAKSAYGFKLPLSEDYVWRWDTPAYGDVVVFPFPVRYLPGCDPARGHSESECRHPDYGKDFIKRVVARPGDELFLKGNVVYVNGKPTEVKVAPETIECHGADHAPCRCAVQVETMGDHEFTTQHFVPRGVEDWTRCSNMASWPSADLFGNQTSFRVPEGHVLVMGDNRDNSSDGRIWGTVPIQLIRGKALFIWYADEWSRIFSLVD
jgi:signal peptidase I